MKADFGSNETYRVKVHPEIGDSYIVEVTAPKIMNDTFEFFDRWIEENLNYIVRYEIIGYQ